MNRRNPYIASGLVHQAQFYGRQDLVEALLDDDQTCIYLVGNRRSGKTSLLHHVQDRASGAVLFLDLQGKAGGMADVQSELLRQVRRAGQRAVLLPNVLLKIEDPLCDILKTLAEAAEDQKRRVLLLWDEGEALLSWETRSLECLHGALQSSRYLRSIVAATKGLSQLNDRAGDGRHASFLDGFETHYVTPLTDQEAEELIGQQRHPEGPVRVVKENVIQIRELTGNQPYLIQWLCKRLFVSARNELRLVTSRDLAVDDELANLFEIDYRTLSNAERRILIHLSQGEQADESELAMALQMKSERLLRFVLGLEQLGYIRYQGGRYQIANRYLSTWLQHLRPVEEEPVSDRASLHVIDHSPPSLLRQTNRSGGVDLTGETVQIGADLVGRDKVDQRQINIHIDHLMIGSPAVQKDALSLSPSAQSLRLDTAVPERVFVQRPFDLAVAVRQPSSPLLSANDLPHRASGEVQVEWPQDTTFIRLRIEVRAPECEILDKGSLSFRLLSGKDSPVFYFHLRPKQSGDLSIFVTVFQEDDSLGSARVHTVAVEPPIGQVHTTISSMVPPSLRQDQILLQHQLAEAHLNLTLIQERKAQYVLEVDIPLQLIKEEQRLKDRIAELEQQLRKL